MKKGREAPNTNLFRTTAPEKPAPLRAQCYLHNNLTIPDTDTAIVATTIPTFPRFSEYLRRILRSHCGFNLQFDAHRGTWRHSLWRSRRFTDWLGRRRGVPKSSYPGLSDWGKSRILSSNRFLASGPMLWAPVARSRAEFLNDGRARLLLTIPLVARARRVRNCRDCRGVELAKEDSHACHSRFRSLLCRSPRDGAAKRSRSPAGIYDAQSPCGLEGAAAELDPSGADAAGIAMG
jgi:hypothetical protein